MISSTNITPITTTTSTGGTVEKMSLQTWRIQGEQGLTGTVTLSPGLGLLWNLKPASGITLPSTINDISTTYLLPSGMTKAIPYGGPLATPVVYVQSSGSYNNTDQMGVYHIGGFGGGAYDYALNTEYSGGSGINVVSDAVTVVSDVAEYVRKIHYPADTTPVLSISTSPTLVTAGIATGVVFTVTSSGTAVVGATVTLTGVASGTGTTISGGVITISVNATGAGTITATASKTGYTNGTTTVISVAIAPPAEAGTSGFLIVGLAVGALLMMKSSGKK